MKDAKTIIEGKKIWKNENIFIVALKHSDSLLNITSLALPNSPIHSSIAFVILIYLLLVNIHLYTALNYLKPKQKN